MMNEKTDDAGDLRARLQRVREAYEMQDYKSCRTELIDIQRTGSPAPDIHRWLARVAHRETDWEDLHQNAAAYLRTNPDDREIVELLGRACSNLRLWPEAENAWDHLTALRPDWPEGWYQLARARLNNRERVQFLHAVRELAALGNGNGHVELLVARLCVDADLLSEATDSFRTCATGDPERLEEEFSEYSRQDNLRGMAATLAAADRASRQVIDTESSRQLAERLIRRALAAEQSGEFLQAHLDYEAAHRLAPSDGLAARAMSRVLGKMHSVGQDRLARGELSRALSSYEDILRLSPSDSKAAMKRARLLTQLHHWGPAAAAWAAVCATVPRDLKSHIHYARAAERAELLEKAGEAWRRVLEIEPENYEALTALARLPARMLKAAKNAVSSQRLADAYEILLRIPPDCAEREDADRRLASLARLLRKEIRGEFKEKQYLRIVQAGGAAMKLLSDDAEIHKLIAKAASRTNNYTIAQAAWRRLAALDPSMEISNYLEWSRCCIFAGEFAECRMVLEMIQAREPENEKVQELRLDLEEQAVMFGRGTAKIGNRSGRPVHSEKRSNSLQVRR
jgi:tetratricopeptide (TPR) repeat protein